MATCSVFLPGKSCGQRNLVGYSPWDHRRVRHNLVTKEQQEMPKARYPGSTLVERHFTNKLLQILLPTQWSLFYLFQYIYTGQYTGLENSMDRGARQAAVHEVSKSRT